MTTIAVKPPYSTVLAAITCVLRVRAPALLSLDHVVQLLDAFLVDAPVVSSLPKAAASGSVHWFNHVYARTMANNVATTPPVRAESNEDILAEYFLGNAMKAAVEHGHLALVERIHSLHPKRLDGRLLPIAAKKGNLEIFQWLLTHRTDDLCGGNGDPSAVVLPSSTSSFASQSCCLDRAYRQAMAHKQHHINDWLFANGFRPSFDWPLHAGDEAAAKGDLEKVQQLHREKKQETIAHHSFTKSAIDRAAKQGHAHVVAFLLTNRSEGFTSQAVHNALMGGYHDIHELLRLSGRLREQELEHLGQWAPDAVKHGRLDLVQSDRYRKTSPPSLLGSALDHGHLPVVQWVCQTHSVPLGAWRAALNGHLHILHWLHDHAETRTNWDKAMDHAAENGHLEIVQWLHKNRTEGCTTKAMDLAAGNGHLPVVQWLHSHRNEGCTVDAMTDAAKNGHLEMVLWLHDHRTEGYKPTVWSGVEQAPLSVLKWLHYNRQEGSWTTSVMDSAAGAGDLAKLQFLYHNRTEGCSPLAMTCAAGQGHLPIVQWLCGKYPHKFHAQTIATFACDNGHRHIVEWLKDQQLIAANEAERLYDY